MTYTVLASDNTTVLATGPINTTDKGATPSVDVSVIASMNDTVKLHAVTSANVTCDGVSAVFNVVAGQNTPLIGVNLICGGSQNKTVSGSLIVNGTVTVGDNCPVLSSWMASPLTTSTGGQIDVSAAATDADATDTVTYAWTATAGTFVAPGSATTKYNCSVGGAQTLTVTVSDNHGATPCTAVQTFPVNCVSLSCGNGVLDTGEACDSSAATDPNKNNCDANCHIICGNGILDGAEQCDPPVANVCSATCQFVPAMCGDNVVQHGESCDPPNGTTCSTTCQSQAVDVNAMCQTCESTSAACDPTLTSVPGAATFGCSGFPAGAAQTACLNLLACIRSNKCNNGDDPTPCFCGALDSITCLSSNGSMTAACYTQYNTALSALTVAGATSSVATLFGNPKSPIGVANNVVSCDVDAHCDTAPLCGAF